MYIKENYVHFKIKKDCLTFWKYVGRFDDPALMGVYIGHFQHSHFP